MSSLSRLEQETIINFNNAEDMETISTARGKWKKKLIELSEEYQDMVKIIGRDDYFVHATLPKKLFTLRSPVKSKDNSDGCDTDDSDDENSAETNGFEE